MNRGILVIGLCLFLAACARTTATPTPTPTPTPPPSNGGGVGGGGEALSVALRPDFDKTFKQVAGAAPFTVNFGANVAGGAAPYTFAWDFDGDGKVDSADATPKPFVLVNPGVYTATLMLKDAAGTSVRATRRIVAIGAAAIPTWRFGVTAHLERRREGYYPTLQDVDHAAELMQAAGIQAARIDFNWDMLNPQKDEWKLDDYDAMVRLVRAHNLDILAIVDYDSWWASSAQTSNDWRVRLYSEPLNDYDYARYAYDLVEHFHETVHVWEIWNEPNTIGFWKPKPDPGHYARLLQEAYLAVKYADPNAVVVFAGMSGNGIDGDTNSGLYANFVPEAYAAGARGYFDVMAIHPYLLPNSGIAAVREKIAAARTVMNQHGDHKIPLWLTEIGWPTDVAYWPTAPVQSENDVATWLEQVYTKLWDQTPTIFWYSLQDQGVGVAPEQKFGLLRLDFAPKPAYEKLRALTGK